MSGTGAGSSKGLKDGSPKTHTLQRGARPRLQPGAAHRFSGRHFAGSVEDSTSSLVTNLLTATCNQVIQLMKLKLVEG